MVTTDDWLPIGSVVYVGGFEDPVMIIGYLGSDAGGGKVWDYFARRYPSGWSPDESDVMFDRDAIEGVLALGYQDEQFAALVDRLDALASELKGAAGPAGEGEAAR